MRMPGKLMSGNASSRSRRTEMSPTASTARKTMIVVTGRASASLVCRMGRPQPAAGSGEPVTTGAGRW